MKRLLAGILVALTMLSSGCTGNQLKFKAYTVVPDGHTALSGTIVFQSKEELDLHSEFAGQAKTYTDEFFKDHILVAASYREGSYYLSHEVTSVKRNGEITIKSRGEGKQIQVETTYSTFIELERKGVSDHFTVIHEDESSSA